MRNIKLIIEYDGNNYQGWQRQTNTRRTLQEIIENTLRRIITKKIILIASGRTDAGVSAVGQVVNFKTDSKIPANKLKKALNSLLPDDIVITKTQDVHARFHARFDVKGKIYRYTILNQEYPSALRRNFAYFYPYKLDLKLMKKAARTLIGCHDFVCFQASPVRNANSRGRVKTSNGASDKKTKDTIRIIKKISISHKGNTISIDIQANGFLYKMVRNIIGTLIQIGRNKQPPVSIKKLIASRNRQFAGPTAPAHGLCLLKVIY